MSDASKLSPDDAPETAHEAPNTAAPGLTGPEVIAGYLRTLPSAPGVYRMLNAEAEVIYVGKARSLKARVSNYARLGGHSNRIARMISRTASMEFVRVNTEAEALLLEANLIKRFRPRFNVLMRDDKSFPYILMADTHDAPQIVKHRGARNKKGDYFGPFASAGAVDRTINMLQRAFLLRTCSDSVFETRTRPCLLFQIKRCAGPCTGEISTGDYAELVNEAKRFLRGESQNVRRMYQELMEQAAERLEYEEAAKYRNRLWALAHVTSEQSINAQSVEEADIFAAHQEGGQTCIQVFFFRSGQNWGNRAYFPKADRALDAPDVLESFIAQFYDDKPVPRLILLSEDLPTAGLLADALSIKATRKVTIQTPKRAGDKKSLVEHAHQNAKEALGRRLAESSSQRILLRGIADRFGLDVVPRRVEVYDNSHISGTNAVGAMIVAGPEGLVKNQYRKFNIKSDNIAPGDDYAMMREVLTRRFKRLLTEHGDGRATDDEAQTIAVDAAGSATSMGDAAFNAEATGDAATIGSAAATDDADASSATTDAATSSSKAPTPTDRHPGEGRDPSGHPPSTAAATLHVAEDASRIVSPDIQPMNRRGADGVPFGQVPADATSTNDQASTGDAAPSAPADQSPEPTPPTGRHPGAGRDPSEPQTSAIDTTNTALDTTADDDDLFAETPSWPDLVLVDGGAGQLSVAKEVFAELGVTDVELIGVAKGPDRDAGREHFHRVGQAKPVMLEPRDPVLYFIQRLRDEAHRFAIGTHRAKRTKAIAANPLDEIAGIGPSRKRALLAHFGSAKAVSRAGTEDLKAVPGISAEMAQKIYDFFHEKQG